MRYHIDIAYFATCCCVVGLAIERYILICHYSEAQTILSKSFRIQHFIVSVVLTVFPVVLKVAENKDNAWLAEVTGDLDWKKNHKRP